MKRLSIWFLSVILILTSCTPSKQEDEIVMNDEEQQQEISIVPNYRLSEENYKIILPYRPSQARGVIVGQVSNRLDINEMEDGLRRHSKEFFDPEKYYFEEGQYLSKDTVYKWLGRSLTKKQLERQLKQEIDQRERDGLTVNDEVIRRIEQDLQLGLNPALKDLDDLDDDEKIKLHEENPRYVSHILEHNFLQRKDDNTVELVGVSIGIAMKSVYRFQTEIGGPYYEQEISEKEMLSQGKEIAQTVLERLRSMEELQNVPILIALFREEEQSSPVPGNFVAKTFVPKADMMIGEWETIHEDFVLFPSSEAQKNFFDEHELMTSFGHKVSEYFPNYTGIIGEGFYINDELQKMSIDIPIEFYGSGEVIGFTQYTYGVAKEIFSPNYDLEIQIKSSERLESIIYREAHEEDLNVYITH